MLPIEQLVLTIGAVARLTRLLTADKITDPIRDLVLYSRAQRRVLRHNARLPVDQHQPLPAPRSACVAEIRAWLSALITCDWCLSVWLAIVVVAAAWTWREHPLTWLVALGLTASYVTGWLAGHETSGRSHKA